MTRESQDRHSAICNRLHIMAQEFMDLAMFVAVHAPPDSAIRDALQKRINKLYQGREKIHMIMGDGDG